MPFNDRTSSDAKIVRELGKASATTLKDGKGHKRRLPHVSTAGKDKMLTPSERALAQVPAMNLGQRIKAAREEAGFTSQTRLSEAIKVSRGLIGQWESHTKKPGLATLRKLARATAKPLSYFLEQHIPDESKLETANRDEIEMVLLYRRMSPEQRKTHLALFRQSVAVRIEK